MINGIIGKKVGMTQLFAPDGTVTPVTVIKAGPCVVVQKKTAAVRTAMTRATRLGRGEARQAEERHEADARAFREEGRRLPRRRAQEFREAGAGTDVNIGDTILVDQFAEGDSIEVVGRSKGRGFQGTIKRHNFSSGPKSHGSMNVRAPGSIGQSAYPSRVIKGTRSSGHMGDDRVTVKGLTVARVDAENHLLLVRGAVPGANGSVVIVKKSARQRKK